MTFVAAVFVVDMLCASSTSCYEAGMNPSVGKCTVDNRKDFALLERKDNYLINFRQGNINEGKEGIQNPSEKHFNPYTEFKEFTRKQIKEFRKKFDT